MKELNVEKYKNDTLMSYLREEEKQDWFTVAKFVRDMEKSVSEGSEDLEKLKSELNSKLFSVKVISFIALIISLLALILLII